MPTKPSNRDIVAILTEKIGNAPNEVVYFEDYVLNLSLSKLGLPQVPSEIGQLTQLQRLDLSGNRLSQLPPEIGKLTQLRVLTLDGNRLSQLPSEIGKLTQLRVLTLDGNRLSQLPPEIGKLTHLWKLILSSNNLSLLPIEIWQLSGLQELYLRNNRLPSLHHDIGKLLNLQLLDLNYNRLSQLPPEIGQLSRLEKLYLDSNHLRHLPPEVGQLSNLQVLALNRNQLKHLPTQIGKLNSLYRFELDNNPYLVTPPPEIIASGLADIKAFLQELQEHSTTRYETKLLVVGEGGTGKSSLLRSLREEMFNPHLSTTHGIEVGSLELPHPNQPQSLMTLNTWDFGGQQIYHATHQFFLTRRSLYLVVWNARLGADQGRLNHWLDTIKALAPDAPVLLVATHIDERTPDLNYQLYKTAYPQLVGQISVSNRTGAGIAELKVVLADNASQLPLMGQPWPQTWLKAEAVLLDRPEHHIDADIYTKCCSACGVKANIAKGTLGNYLHDLGKILYFRDDYVLSNLVVLKPNWVTKAISRVLTDEATSAAKGILSHSNLPRIWATDDEGQPYEPYLYPVFLRLMERFDLSYQIESDIPGDNPIHSLIPQLLPHQPPVNLPAWPKSPAKGQSQVEMVYRFDFVPAGIMSWFIVRTHRYAQNLHWREGVLLTYEGHQARVELNPMLRELRLIVKGPLPQNFFTILKNTIDLILDRFEGLGIQREVPCICHWERGVTVPCSRIYQYEDLVRRMEAGKHKVECPDTFVDVSVPMLLYGIHTSTDQQVMDDIQQGQKKVMNSLDEMKKEDLQMLDIILEKVNQQSELIWRNFTRQWNLEMKKLEAECPNTFILTPSDGSLFNFKNWMNEKYQLILICQHPPGPHRVGQGYRLKKAREWWIQVSPWLNYLIKFLRFGVPLGKVIGVVIDEVDVKQMQSYIDMMEQIINDLPELADLDSMKHLDKQLYSGQDSEVVGPALRGLYSFLKEVDPIQNWGGLHKTLTPDGNILWLCGNHHKQFEVKPLELKI